MAMIKKLNVVREVSERDLKEWEKMGYKRMAENEEKKTPGRKTKSELFKD